MKMQKKCRWIAFYLEMWIIFCTFVAKNESVMKKNAFNELPPKKVVLVIGNGFDLDMKQQTSYTDFVNSIYFKYLIDPNQENPVEMMEGVDEDKLIRIPNGMASYVMEQKEHNNWVDLEECIREYCEKQPENTVDKARLRGELFSIRYMLYHYLARVVYYNFEDRDSHFKNHIAYKLLEGIVNEDVSCEIWDFNYTFTCETLLERLNIESDVISNHLHYIHGQLRRDNGYERWPIVLGSDSTEKLEQVCPSAVKCHTRGYFDNCSAFKEDLKDAETVVFMGHSMGSTDRPYFSEMLKSDKLKSVVVITKSEASLNDFRANINAASENLFAQRTQDATLREVTYTSDGYYDLYSMIDANKSKEFADVIHMIIS